LHSIPHAESNIQYFSLDSDRKDESVEQTIEDLFVRLEVAGEDRDHAKKQWYSWAEQSSQEDRKIMILSWRKIHTFMQDLLETLMEKLSDEVGSP
jgi:hypothetical protein